MKIFLIIVALFLFTGDLFAAQSYKLLNPEQTSELVNSEGRIVKSLAGTWKKSYDNLNWSDAAVPFTEQECNTVTYKKEIRWDKNFIENNNLHFVFPGLAGQVEIYFNEDFLIKYDGSGLPIDVAVSSQSIVAGNNELKLIFTPTSKLEKQLNIANYNAPKIIKGIIREPFLVATSKIWISEIKYAFTQNSNLEASISCSAGQINNSKNSSDSNAVGLQKTKITIEYQVFNKRSGRAELPAESRLITVENSRTTTININIPTNTLKQWSVESPELYILKARVIKDGVVIDDYFVNFGLKRLTCNKDKGFILNGESIEIKAISYNEYYSSVLNTLTAYRMEEDIKSIKILGANAIRFQNNSPHPYLAYLCDKYGLLMFVDMLSLCNTPEKFISHEDVIAKSKNILSRIISNYSNNVSFSALSLGTSVYECAAYKLLTQQIIATMKKTKILKYKIVDLGMNQVDVEGLDFICMNARYAEQYDKMRSKLAEAKKYQLPILFAFSTFVHPKNHNGYSSPNSLEHQAFFIKNCYSMSKSEKTAGCIINSFNDYATNYPVLALNYYNNYILTNGLNDSYRNTRLSYFVVKALLNNEKIPLLNAGTYESEAPISYTIFGLLVLLALLLMLNKYTRFREYFVRSILRPYNFYADVRDNRIMSIAQTGILAIIIAFSMSLCYSSIMIALRNNLDYNYLFRAIIPYNSLLNTIVTTIWKPNLLLFFFLFIILMKLVIMSAILRLVAILLRARIFFENALTMVVWSALPFVFLLPVGILFSQLLMSSEIYIGLFFVIMTILAIWFILRLLKSCSVVFDKPIIKAYSIGTAILILFIVIPVFIYENSNNTFAFINYFCYLP